MLKVLIVDDEPLARLRLATLLGDIVHPAVQVAGEAGSAAAALQWLAQQRADVLLLDIHMPGLDGMQLAQRLRGQARAPAVIFVTAHAEHALAAFEVRAIDYLTKPVRRARLQEALERAVVWLARETPSAFGALGVPGVAAAAVASDAQPVLVVHDRGERVRVPLAEVLYLKAEAKYVTLRTAQRAYLLDEPLAELEARLSPAGAEGAAQRFLRVHRNAIVALAAVRSLERRRGLDAQPTGFDGDAPMETAADGTGWAVHIAAVDEWLAVSRRQLALVREALEQA